MSYIRSSNNPEGLYIFESSSGKVTIMNTEKIFEVSKASLYNILNKYLRFSFGEGPYVDCEKGIKSGKLILREEFVFNGKSRHFLSWKYVLLGINKKLAKNIRIKRENIWERFMSKIRMDKFFGSKDVDLQWVLYENGVKLFQMWDVTFQTILFRYAKQNKLIKYGRKNI